MSTTEIVLDGIHATCLTSAKEILRTHDYSHAQGMAGAGFYLWKTEPLGMELARCWHAKGNREGKFKHTPEPEFAGIRCSIVVEEDNFLNFNDPEISDMFDKYFLTHKSEIARATGGSRRSSYNVVEQFVLETERNMRGSFKVIEKRVMGPQCPEYPRELLNDPVAYVVREVSVIDTAKLET